MLLIFQEYTVPIKQRIWGDDLIGFKKRQSKERIGNNLMKEYAITDAV